MSNLSNGKPSCPAEWRHLDEFDDLSRTRCPIILSEIIRLRKLLPQAEEAGSLARVAGRKYDRKVIKDHFRHNIDLLKRDKVTYINMENWSHSVFPLFKEEINEEIDKLERDLTILSDSH